MSDQKDGDGNPQRENPPRVLSDSEEKSRMKQPVDPSLNIPTAVSPALTLNKRRDRNGVHINERSIGRDEKEYNREGAGDSDSDHDQPNQKKLHIMMERDRRKRMRDLFSTLRSLLPELPAKVDKYTIVDEAVRSIKNLENTLHELEKLKQERVQSALMTKVNPSPSALSLGSNSIASTSTNQFSSWVSSFPVCFQSWSCSNAVLNVCGTDAQICLCTPKKSGLLTGIIVILEKYRLEVVTVHIASDSNQGMYMIHARANVAANPLFETLPLEQIYRMAVEEISVWLSCS